MKKVVLLLIFTLFFAIPAIAKTATTEKQINETQKTEKENPNLSADAMILYNSNNIEGALKILNSIPEDNRTALDWLLMGNIYQDKENIEKAAIMFKKSTLVNTKFYRGYYNLGYLYLEDENPKEAIKLFKIALKYKPDFSYAHYNMGTAYIKTGDLKRAKASLLKAIKHKKDYPDAYYNLIYVYKELGDTKNAQEYLKIYNELSNRNL